MLKKKLTIKIILFLIFSDILETLIHLCFKKGVSSYSYQQVSTLADLLAFFTGVFSSPFLWLGLLLVFLTFIVWSTILSKIDLSVAVPIASFSYILVPFTSALILHETVSWLRWSGVFFILVGVIFVSLSTREKEAHL